MQTGSGGMVEVCIGAALAGERLDRAVSMVSGVSRSMASEMVASGMVELGATAPRSEETSGSGEAPVDAVGNVALRLATDRTYQLREGEWLVVHLPDLVSSDPEPDPSVSFGVVYEDEDLVVVDKPAGLVVHHGAGHERGTLVDGLVARYPDLGSLGREGLLGDPARPGIVHRLDKGTSGLVVVARSARAYSSLCAQMRLHTATRRYQALVHGLVQSAQGVVDAPIGRSERQATRMAVKASGRPARTHYRVIRRFGDPTDATLIEASLETGRTHQVRVHMAAIGHPVVGDDRYGRPGLTRRFRSASMVPGRLFLHAGLLEVEHPAGWRASWTSPLPDDLRLVLDEL